MTRMREDKPRIQSKCVRGRYRDWSALSSELALSVAWWGPPPDFNRMTTREDLLGIHIYDMSIFVPKALEGQEVQLAGAFLRAKRAMKYPKQRVRKGGKRRFLLFRLQSALREYDRSALVAPLEISVQANHEFVHLCYGNLTVLLDMDLDGASVVAFEPLQ